MNSSVAAISQIDDRGKVSKTKTTENSRSSVTDIKAVSSSDQMTGSQGFSSEALELITQGMNDCKYRCFS